MIGKTQLDAIIFSSNISIMTTEAVNSLFILKIFLLVSVKTSKFFFAFPWMRDIIYCVTFLLIYNAAACQKSSLCPSPFFTLPWMWHKIVRHSGKLCSCSSVRFRGKCWVAFSAQVSSHICTTCNKLPTIHLSQIHREISSTHRSLRELELCTSSIAFWGIDLKLWQLHNSMLLFDATWTPIIIAGRRVTQH